MTESVQILMEIKKSLLEPKKFSELWQAYPMVWQDIQWQKEQLSLWLAAQPGIQVNNTDINDPVYQIKGKVQGQDDLGEIIYDIVCKNKLPMPMAQLKTRLPAKLVATEPMILSAVKAHEKLVSMGPLIKITGVIF